MKHLFSIDFYITYACSVVSVMSNSFVTLWTSLPGSSVHGDSPGKNTGVSCSALCTLPGDLPDRDPEMWDQTRISYVSCIEGRCFTAEPLGKLSILLYNQFLEPARLGWARAECNSYFLFFTSIFWILSEDLLLSFPFPRRSSVDSIVFRKV